jgi:pilus assembly protein CpaE
MTDKSAEHKIRVMVVDDVETSRDTLARLLSFESDMDVVGTAATGTEAIEMSEQLKPDVILMDINMPDMDGLTATEEITRNIATSVVMISVQSDRDYIRRALQVGASDFLPKPPSAEELYEAIRRAYDRKPEPVSPPPGIGGKSKPAKAGKVVVVYSPQGGAGVTTLAVSLAQGLMTKEERVVLIDANLQFGDVAIHLDLPNELNLLNLLNIGDEPDPDLIENVLTTHAGGVRVLAAPARPEEGETVQAENLVKVVRELSKNFAFTIVDTAPHLDDVTVSLFEIADMLVMVGVPTLPAVKNLRLTLDLIIKIDEIDNNKIVFVLNQVPSERRSGAIDPEAISNTLKLPVRSVIPFEPKAMRDAVNRGVPAIANARQTPGKELQTLVDDLRTILEPQEQVEEAIAEPEEEKKSRRWF